MGDAVRKIVWTQKELDAAKPPEEILISDFMSENHYLDKHSAVQGLFPLRLVPTLIPIIDACLNPDVEEIVFCKPAQYAGTTFLVGIALYYIFHETSPVMFTLADERTAKYVGSFRLQYAIEKNPRFKKLIQKDTYSKAEMSFKNGGYIVLGWAASTAGTGTRTIKINIIDETDKDGYSRASAEAGSISRIKERTSSHPASKTFITSTPTDDKGNITKELESCDIILDSHVPCPFCKWPQPLRWNKEHAWGFKDGLYRAFDGQMHKLGMVVWDGGGKASKAKIRKTARYKCGECGELWTTAQKNRAIDDSIKVSRTKPKGGETKIGYHENRLTSKLPGGRLVKMVIEWLASQDDLDLLQGFINSTLAEPFVLTLTSKTETQILKAKCSLPPQVTPEDAAAVTLYIDNQKYEKWFTVLAWNRSYDVHVIDYGHVPNYDELEEIIFNTTYPVHNSIKRRLGFWRIAIDTGGGRKFQDASMTEECYLWIMSMYKKGIRIYPTKGSSTAIAEGILKIGKPLLKTPTGRSIPGGLQIISLDTVKLKDKVHAQLDNAIEKRARGLYLHKDTSIEYADHISAEKKKMTKKGIVYYEQLRADNHLLDCTAGSMSLGDPLFPGGGVHLLPDPFKVEEEKEKVDDKQNVNNFRKIPDWRGSFRRQ